MTVRALTPDLTAADVALYRTIRLDALQADPTAFGSSYEREAAFDEEQWRTRLTGVDGRDATFFVDELDGFSDKVGSAAVATAGIAYTEWDAAPMLIGMWVRPEARGLGCGKRLAQAALDWASDRGEPEVVLWVVKGNAAAISLYSSCGFVATGKTDTLPSNPSIEELEMHYTIRR